MQSLSKLLIVDDDRQLTNTLASALKSSYNVDIANSGRLGLFKTENDIYDLIVLDLNLPDISGFEICKQLRHRGVEAPILILSGETKTLTKINVLDGGANDYLTKPFSLGELQARLRAMARVHKNPVWPSVIICIGDVNIDRNNYSATRSGIDLTLRRKEFELLACLMEHADNLVTREQLISQVWRGRVEPWANTIDVHIKYLRDKLDRPFDSTLIETVHGLGYKFISPKNRRLQS
jgi:two-component system OmpR family response regulator